MQEVFKQLLQQFISGTKCGASVWTTFRFVSNLLFFFCWCVALPVELILNRRMGRRYIGVLPILGSILVMAGWFYLMAPAITNARSAVRASANQAARQPATPPGRTAARPSSPAADNPAIKQPDNPWGVSGVVVVIVVLAWYRHRLANWWRFQSDEQVHSFSSGVPFYLHLPGWLARPVADAPRSLHSLLTGSSGLSRLDEWSWRERVQDAKAGQRTLASLAGFAFEVGMYAMSLLRQFWREWKSGEVPTGPVMWVAATIIHPALVIAGAALLMPYDSVLAVYVMFAGVAILLKARIQKAVVVEAVYDLFDARLEQEFASALSNPNRLRSVERRGFTVPGLARALVTLPGAVERKPASPAAQSQQPSADNHTIEPKVSVGVKPDGGLSTVVADQPSPADVRPASRRVRTIEPKPSGQSAGDRSGNDVDPGSSSHAGPFN